MQYVDVRFIYIYIFAYICDFSWQGCSPLSHTVKMLAGGLRELAKKQVKFVSPPKKIHYLSCTCTTVIWKQMHVCIRKSWIYSTNDILVVPSPGLVSDLCRSDVVLTDGWFSSWKKNVPIGVVGRIKMSFFPQIELFFINCVAVQSR